MPKLPANFVKAPSFDNPLRSTTAKPAISEHKLVLRLDDATWALVLAAGEREGLPPETLAHRALLRWLREPEPVAMAARGSATPSPTPRTSLRAQLIERLQERLTRGRWVQRLLSVREVWRY